MDPLVNLMPAKARKWTYAVLSAAVFVYGLWEAAQGNWTQFAVSVATSGVTSMAAANTDTSGVMPCPDPGLHDPLLGGFAGAATQDSE